MTWLILLAALARAEDAPPAEPLPAAPVAEPAPFVGASGQELVDEAWKRVDLGDWEGARIVAELALGRDLAVRDGATAALGASWELEGRPDRAIPLYEEVLTRTEDAAMQDHMRLRIAECYGQLGQPDEALRRLEPLAASRDRPLADGLKIALLRGVWQLESGDHRRGTRSLRRALEAAPADEVAFYQAKARAALAARLCAEAAALPLDGRERRAVRNLRERAALIALAEEHVVTAIQLQEPEWALEGLLLLGGAYERVGDDLLAMPVPAKLGTPDLRAAYADVLGERVEILYVNAGKHYEQGVDLAIRLSWRSRRIALLEARLGEVQGKVDRLAASAAPARQ